ncbi:MAG: cytosine-specific methylase [Rhodoferax sp.]|nr:cytosine-specific methylase [Rhodoferax sp.]
MDIIRTMLADMHYELQATVLDSAEWGAFEQRKRLVMAAVTRGVNFSFESLVRPAIEPGTLADILEPVALDDARWSRMDGLKDKAERDAAAGKGFAMQIFDGASSKICTLTKGLTKNRSADAKIQHPTNPDLLRIPGRLD